MRCSVCRRRGAASRCGSGLGLGLGMPAASGQIPPPWAWWENEAPGARAAYSSSQAQPVRLSTIAIAAEADFDASDGAGPGASLTFVGVAGDLVVRVPPGSRVREGGFSLIGDRQIEVAAGDGPEIQVKVYGLFSDVKVTDQPS
jgi:hypothetical protein